MNKKHLERPSLTLEAVSLSLQIHQNNLVVRVVDILKQVTRGLFYGPRGHAGHWLGQGNVLL